MALRIIPFDPFSIPFSEEIKKSLLNSSFEVINDEVGSVKIPAISSFFSGFKKLVCLNTKNFVRKMDDVKISDRNLDVHLL
jgi:hypothetical protein